MNSRDVFMSLPRVTVQDRPLGGGTAGRRADKYTTHMLMCANQAVNLSRIRRPIPRLCSYGIPQGLLGGIFEPPKQMLQGVVGVRIAVLARLGVHLSLLVPLVLVLSGEPAGQGRTFPLVHHQGGRP